MTAEEFDRNNPEVRRLFDRFTFEVIRAGRAHGSVAMVFERIRWESAVATRGAGTTPDGEPLKLNNNYKPWYSRSFMERHPQHEGFFRTREAAVDKE